MCQRIGIVLIKKVSFNHFCPLHVNFWGFAQPSFNRFLLRLKPGAGKLANPDEIA